jgi:hypothetical protein
VLIHDILFFRFSSIKTSIKREKGEDKEKYKGEELNIRIIAFFKSKFFKIIFVQAFLNSWYNDIRYNDT